MDFPIKIELRTFLHSRLCTSKIHVCFDLWIFYELSYLFKFTLKYIFIIIICYLSKKWSNKVVIIALYAIPFLGSADLLRYLGMTTLVNSTAILEKRHSDRFRCELWHHLLASCLYGSHELWENCGQVAAWTWNYASY